MTSPATSSTSPDNVTVPLPNTARKFSNVTLTFKIGKSPLTKSVIGADVRRTTNAGVLEHFHQDEQVTILKEMARITKPDGKIVVLTPNSKCMPYLVGKATAERVGTWMYGEEYPIESMREAFRLSGMTVLEETHTGFLESLDFLDFIDNSTATKEEIRLWYEALEPHLKKNFPGYLVVTVGQIETNDSSQHMLNAKTSKASY